MYLMNKDTPVLWFDDGDKLIKVLNNKMLPLHLQDFIKDSDEIKTISEGINNYDKLRHFFADRVLSLSRENAKQILQSIQNTQKLTEEESYQLALKCRGVSISDNFWVKNDNESLTFEEINIRNRHLNDVIFQISMKGTPVSIQHDLLAADISTKGMFRKTWVRENNELWLYKSDKTNGINVKAEVAVSDILKEANYPHIEYELVEKEDILCCKSKCFVTDSISFVDAEYVKAYCEHHNIDFLQYIKNNFASQFADMIVIDYCIGNPDEHMNNWGFYVDARTNEIISIATKFDNNQALIVFEFHKESTFDELIYPPTNKNMLDSVKEWAHLAIVDLSNVSNINVSSRYKQILGLIKDFPTNAEIEKLEGNNQNIISDKDISLKER